jgi:hypothetical protein
MSIVRVGLAETKNFSDGYDLIFGKKDDKDQKKDDKEEQKPAEERAANERRTK